MGVEVEKEIVKVKRGPIVPIPADAPKMPMLDVHRKECTVISDEIRLLITEIQTSRDGTDTSVRDAEKQKLIKERGELIKLKKNATEQISQLREQLKNCFN